MKLSDIFPVYKKKGSKLELKNYRGIFTLPALRQILDKLTYNDKYSDLEESMSDSNIGSLKFKNIRNHLFMVYGIINDVHNGKSACIDIQIYDLVQAFDALWLEDCMNDIFDAVSKEKQDDKLALIYKSNVENLVAINAPSGQTNRVPIESIVQQGGSWSSMECSNSTDKLGKIIYKRGEHNYVLLQRNCKYFTIFNGR